MKKIFVSLLFFYVNLTYAQIFERFTDSGIASSYTNGSFVGDGNVRWNYVQARGNQQTTENGDKAVSLNKAADACIFSDTIAAGIRFLSFQYEQELTANCDASVFVNDVCVGSLTTDQEVDVTKFFSVTLTDFLENAVVKIQQNSKTSGQITIDDIYIELAQTPFECNKIEWFDTVLRVTFSHNLLHANVVADKENVVRKVEVEKNVVTAILFGGLCGKQRITFSGLKDTALSMLPDTTVELAFYGKPRLNSIVFTEIMADPSPVVGLSEFEYVEFCNLGDCAVQCSDLQFVVGSTSYKLPSRIMEPQEYVCLISSKAKQSIKDTSHVLFLNSFPSIANSGQSIALMYDSQIISSLSFSDSWYCDAFKKDGGWSLEKIDVENFSETKENWKVAQNRLGGTPGYENSVSEKNLDVEPPCIQTIQIENDTIVIVSFSENIDGEYLRSIIIEPDVEIGKICPTENLLSKYHIFTKTPLSTNTEYNFITENFTDFAGNEIEDSRHVFAKTDSVLMPKSIIVSEILFNPKSGFSDFVEIYNNSDSYFDLADLFISNGDSYVRITENYRLFPPKAYVVISPDAEFYEANCRCNDGIFISANLPTLPDKEGLVMLLNRWEEIIDSVYYDEKFHSSYIRDKEGVSLERTFNAFHFWFSAAESAGFSTPGCPNSQQKINETRQSLSLLSDVVTPNGDGENDEMILFCGEVELGTMCSVRVLTTSGKLVRHISSNQLLGSSDMVRWNVTDENGKIVPAGIYIIQIELFRNGKKVGKEKFSCSVLRE